MTRTIMAARVHSKNTIKCTLFCLATLHLVKVKHIKMCVKVKTIKTNKLITTIMLKITIPKLSIYVQTTSIVIIILIYTI